MAAGIATLEVLAEEKLVEKADAMGRALLADLQGLAQKPELPKEVRGKGLMIGLEFGAPQSLRLQTAWPLMDSARRGLLCQLALLPLDWPRVVLGQVWSLRIALGRRRHLHN